MAVFVVTGFAFFASGSVIFDALSISRVELDLSWFTSASGDTGVVSELESFSATFTLVGGWTGASLTGGVTFLTLLGSKFNSVSISIFSFSSVSVSNFVHTPTAGGAFAFIHTALLTVGFTFEADVGFFVVVESHARFVIWAFLLTDTDHLSDLLGFSFKLGSGGFITINVLKSSFGVPDSVHSFIVSQISGFCFGFDLTSFVQFIEIGSFSSRDSLFGGKDSSWSWFSFHGLDHLDVDLQEIFSREWLVDSISNFLSIFVFDTQSFLVGDQDTFTFASKAARSGSVNTLTAIFVTTFTG
jgi:hypothetical protein